MMKLTFEVPDTRGLGQEAIDLWRPDIARWIEGNVKRLVERIQSKLGKMGPSSPGEAPGKRSGDYQKSWSHDMKEYKRSTHGRVGSTLWQRFGDSLELGNKRIRPRPHVGNSFEAWRREVIRDIEANNRG